MKCTETGARADMRERDVSRARVMLGRTDAWVYIPASSIQKIAGSHTSPDVRPITWSGVKGCVSTLDYALEAVVTVPVRSRYGTGIDGYVLTVEHFLRAVNVQKLVPERTVVPFRRVRPREQWRRSRIKAA
ncbi:hypothetical protein N9L26_02390 [Candidatus Pacebacteria bacterium]|nr:hypothetical protein [Candidatus Paceibacterota bacterium]